MLPPVTKCIFKKQLTITPLVLRIGVMKDENKIFSLNELCTITDMNKRKVRFYIQKGLVDRPEGTGKGAYYTLRHLEQLLAIRKWKDAGLSLERIQDIINEAGEDGKTGKPLPPPRPRRPGSIEVWSRLYIDDGIELHIEPGRSGLTPEQVRAVCSAVAEQYRKIKAEEN